MKKIIIIGSCGAGKTTFAQKINKKLNLPLTNLDQLYWKPGWERTSKTEWREKVEQLVKGDKWIIDGNYQSTFDIRFPACDTIIFLDINRFTCLFRILKRRFLKNRIDVLNKCEEKIDWKFLKWVLWDFPQKGKKKIKKYLKKYDKKVVVLKNGEEMDCFDGDCVTI